MTLNRHTVLLLMLAGSVGLPYLSSTELGQQASKAMDGGHAASDSPQSAAPTASNSATTFSSTNSSTSYPRSDGSAQSSATYARSYSDSASPSSYSTPPASSTTPATTSGATTSAASTAGAYTAAAAGAGSSYADAGRNESARKNTAPNQNAADSPAAKTPDERSPVAGVPPQTLREVLRFDVTVPWIIESWPRVSAGLSELDLHGYRVPLMTGTGESDLAGSLTYYFNKKQQLDRIIFHGTSGDPRALIAVVTGEFQLKRVIVNDPGLAFYQRKSWGRSHSELLIRPARVLRADVPNKRYEIEMALKRP